MPWDLDSLEDEGDETAWMLGRQTDHTYTSSSFTLKRPGSADDGSPARFIIKVFDDDGCEEASVETEGAVWPISASPAGRVQVKLLVAKSADHIKDLWVQKLRTSKDGTQTATNVLHLAGPEAESLAELFRNLPHFPIQGDRTTRLDDGLVRRLLADSTALATYNLDSNVIRTLIEKDDGAKDVIAAAGRRAAVERFREMLDEPLFFESEKKRLGVSGDEAVWQAFFEENPWILGIGLTNQLVTSWDKDRLEQVVRGYSIKDRGKRTDALLRTAGIIRSMVFAEFKTATTALLKPREYRPGCWGPSKDLAGGVSQMQGTVHAAVSEIGHRIASLDQNGAELPGDWTYLFQPRSFLVIGTHRELTNASGGHYQGKVRSFELYRRNLWMPDVVTFDELLARAEWIAAIDP